MNFYSQAPPLSMSVSPAREPVATYQLAVKGKFDAGRAFDFEDDAEFCPALSDEEIQFTRMMNNPNGLQQQMTPGRVHAPPPVPPPPPPPHSGPMQQQHHHHQQQHFSPYTPSNNSTPPHNYHDLALYNQSPSYYLGSPVSRNNSSLVSSMMNATANSSTPVMTQSQSNSSNNTPRSGVKREQRAVEIIDPSTGGRVGSPSISFASYPRV